MFSVFSSTILLARFYDVILMTVITTSRSLCFMRSNFAHPHVTLCVLNIITDCRLVVRRIRCGTRTDIPATSYVREFNR